MIGGDFSLRARNPKLVAEWYKHLGFEVVDERADVGVRPRVTVHYTH